MKQRLQQHPTEFSVGQIRHCLSQWEGITCDKEILNVVKGVDIGFSETEIPSQESGAAAFFTVTN